MTSNMKTSEVLDLAADAIQQRGWQQVGGWPMNPHDTPLCMEGGIMAAMGMRYTTNSAYRDFQKCPAYRAVWDYLDADEMWEDTCFREALYDWNDALHRTDEEVIAVLRATAAVERVKESEYDTEDQPLPLEQVAA